MSRVWALRLVFVSLGLLLCLFILREAIMNAFFDPWQVGLTATSRRVAQALLYEGWGVAVLLVSGLYGLYRLFLARIS